MSSSCLFVSFPGLTQPLVACTCTKSNAIKAWGQGSCLYRPHALFTVLISLPETDEYCEVLHVF